jgi:pSer/pThr/pTyr-binding forkhead associated (FHA) protein
VWCENISNSDQLKFEDWSADHLPDLHDANIGQEQHSAMTVIMIPAHIRALPDEKQGVRKKVNVSTKQNIITAATSFIKVASNNIIIDLSGCCSTSSVWQNMKSFLLEEHHHMA